jgi:hypothetical protein
MSVTTLARVSFTFGTEEAKDAVVERIAERGDAGALWGTLNETDALTFQEATRDTTVLDGAFSFGAFSLDAEQTAELFLALVEFSDGESECDIDGDDHTGAFCDCDKRNRAHSWATDIAESYGVELI